jgi:hypothetical protein
VAHAVLDLQQRDGGALQAAGKASNNLLRVHDLLWIYPIVTVPFLASRLDLTFAAVNGLVRRLVGLGLLTETTGEC